MCVFILSNILLLREGIKRYTCKRRRQNSVVRDSLIIIYCEIMVDSLMYCEIVIESLITTHWGIVVDSLIIIHCGIVVDSLIVIHCGIVEYSI